MTRLRRAAVAILVVVGCGTTMSGATYTASSTNPDGVFATATNFGLQVAVTDPGSPLRGSVTVTVTASDLSGATIASVRVQRAAAGSGSWTDVCTDTTSPYSCALDTTALPDGFYDLRAIATNSAAETRTSAVVAARHIDNGAPSVTMSALAAWLRGSITLASTTADPIGGTGVASVRYEYTTTGGTSWTTACTASSAPFSCSFDTAGLTNGTGYDFRAVATDGAGNATTSAAVTNRRVDNAAPTAAMTDPGTPLKGTVSLAGTAGDTHSGVASVSIQASAAGAASWTDICTDTTSPYSCSWNTAAFADGRYDLRLVATDLAGNTTASAVVVNRHVDNTPPSVTFDDPGEYLRGYVLFTATASDGAGTGVTSVKFQYKTSAGTTWTDLCTDTTVTYSCWVNASGANGWYDFRAIATDGMGYTTTSAVVTRLIDNTAPTVTMDDPGSPLSATAPLTATASDGGSGVASVRIEMRPAGGAWSVVCTSASGPWSCALDTTTLADGLYEFRAVATDRAGNAATSAAVTNRRIDNNAPTVTMDDPGAWISGTPTLSATAADGDGAGVTSVTFEYAPAGTSSWTTACSDATAPYSCSFDGTGLTEGAFYDFRAVAVDGAGFGTASALVANRRPDKGAPTGVTMDDPGSPLTGSVTFTGGASDSLSGVAGVSYQYWSGVAWVDICTATGSPWSCSADTSAVPDGTHDLRARAADAAGNATVSATIAARAFDNTDPSVTMTDPGANLRGSVAFAATASDGAGTGVVSVTIARSPAGAGTWTQVCVDTSSPYTCAPLDTTTLSDGVYDFRATAVDGSGRTSVSTVINRRVDNTLPETTLSDPGTPLSGTVALDAAATDTGGSGVLDVTIERSPAGANTWTDICTDASAPYSCSWDTTAVGDGSYDLRSVATDAAGNAAATAILTRTVDNPPRAVDVQTTNGGTAGQAGPGDAITFTYSEPMAPGSIIAGWDGSSRAVTVSIINSGGANDYLTVYSGGTLVRVTGTNGLVLGANHVGGSGADFNATLTRSGSTFIVTLGTRTGGSANVVGAATMTWYPGTLATDLGGNALVGGAVSESGSPADVDF